MKRLSLVLSLFALLLSSCARTGKQSSTVVLEGGRYVTFPLQLAEKSEVTMTVKVGAGKPVNTYLMNNAQLLEFVNSRKKEGFKDGVQFEYLKDLSAPSVMECTMKALLDAGYYSIVLTPTDVAESKADEASKVTVSVTWKGHK